MTAPAATTPRLTAENIFYNGFAAVAPLGTTQGGSYLDSELQTFAPDVPSNVGYYADNNTRALRLKRQLIALVMVLGRRINQINDNIVQAEKNNGISLATVNMNLAHLLDAMKGFQDANVQQQRMGAHAIVQGLKDLQIANEKAMKKQSGDGQPFSAAVLGLPVFSSPQTTGEEKAKSTMMSRLIQDIVSISESDQETATPAKLYANMARNGQFDPDAGVNFNQLVAEAKSKGFIVEQTAANGTRYLKLSV